MSPWVLLFIVAAAKIPIAALMLWWPFRSDQAMLAEDEEEADSPSDGDGGGGTKAPPTRPYEPHPRGPLGRPRRRGPHGSPSSPKRARGPLRHLRPRVLR
jgi:hypothetical protein